MTDLLTPKQMRKELAAAEDAALLEVDADMQRAYLRVTRICRNYLTLWDELEHEREISDNAVKRVTQLEQMLGALGR